MFSVKCRERADQDFSVKIPQSIHYSGGCVCMCVCMNLEEIVELGAGGEHWYHHATSCNRGLGFLHLIPVWSQLPASFEARSVMWQFCPVKCSWSLQGSETTHHPFPLSASYRSHVSSRQGDLWIEYETRGQTELDKSQWRWLKTELSIRGVCHDSIKSTQLIAHRGGKISGKFILLWVQALLKSVTQLSVL